VLYKTKPEKQSNSIQTLQEYIHMQREVTWFFSKIYKISILCIIFP